MENFNLLENFGSYSNNNNTISNVFLSNQDEFLSNNKIGPNKTTNINNHKSIHKSSKYNNTSPSIHSNNNAINKHDINSNILNSDFQILYKKFENSPEEEKDNFRRIINVFAILLECPKYYINKLFEYKSDKLSYIFNLYTRGRTKEFQIRKEKDRKFNFFESLYKTHQKLIKSQFVNSNSILDFNDILYDVFGLPILECDLRNKLVINKMISGIKNLLETENCIILLINDEEFENNQFCYQILSQYELNQKIKVKEFIIKENERNEELLINEEELNFNEITMNNILFKLRKFNTSINLKTLYDYKYLLEDRNNDIQICKELYPIGNSNFTFISINEIFSQFTRMICIEEKKYELQYNGKFIKCKRDDEIIEYKSRWIYSFNVTQENVDLTIEIHQNIPNSTLFLINYLYVGFVVLKSNMSMLNFVEYLPMKDVRQNFLKLRLSKGSYVIIPITSGFYFGHPKEPKYEIEKIPLLENSKHPKTNKITFDFSQIAKNIIDEIFDKFDVNKNGFLTINELTIFYNFTIENNSNEDDSSSKCEEIFKSYLDSSNQINLKNFRNYFFFLVKSFGEEHIYNIFKKFGYNYIMNYECRHFFMSFYSNEQIEIKLSDGLNTKFNSYAYELYLKHVGTIMNLNENKYINMIYDQTKDSCNIILMLENKSENEKKVTFEIECTGYISLNGFKYQNNFKGKESKFLFCIAIDKNLDNELSQKSLWIKYHIKCE